ncbi:MAG: hypothetical protein JWP08_4419 [Bryobacterales bacterium]|nr:hypothetical protein [Bryobacterales bacterium]
MWTQPATNAWPLARLRAKLAVEFSRVVTRAALLDAVDSIILSGPVMLTKRHTGWLPTALAAAAFKPR